MAHFGPEVLRFGVNYVPSRDWYYAWNDFQPDDFARDFDAIAGIGADHIRLQTIWPWFQPNPKAVSGAHLARLRTVVESAGARGLDVWVCAFTGWLSGYRFAPPFQDPETFYEPSSDAPQALYLRELAGALGDLPAFAGFDLGNELNCAWQAPDPTVGDAWMERRFAEVDALLPDRLHVNGVDHNPWFHPFTFSPAALAARPLVTLHCWSFFTGALDRGGPLDPPAANLLAGMAALARSFGGDDRPVWAQEYGAVDTWMPAAQLGPAMDAMTRRGIDGGVSWFTWWCSHDIDRKYRFDELEYGMGLLDQANRPKPHAEVFRALAAEFRGQPRRPSPAVPPPPAHDHASVWAWLEAFAAGSA